MRMLLALLLLAGCSSYADRVASTCARLGAPMGTENYWSCVEMQHDIDQRDRAMWGRTTAAGAYMLAPAPTVYVRRW